MPNYFTLSICELCICYINNFFCLFDKLYNIVCVCLTSWTCDQLCRAYEQTCDGSDLYLLSPGSVDHSDHDCWSSRIMMLPVLMLVLAPRPSSFQPISSNLSTSTPITTNQDDSTSGRENKERTKYMWVLKPIWKSLKSLFSCESFQTLVIFWIFL